MSNLIPFNPQAAEELDGEFSSTMFRSTAEFIQFYNSGFVNKREILVANLAAKVDETFKNVKLQGSTLVFISEHEVYMEEFMPELTMWYVLVKIKREVESAIMDGRLREDGLIVFMGENPGVLQHHRENSEDSGEESANRVSDERFFKPSDVNIIHAIRKRFSTAEGSTENNAYFHASDFVNADDSFIGEIYRSTFHS